MTAGVNAHAEHDDRPDEGPTLDQLADDYELGLLDLLGREAFRADWERTIAIKRRMPPTAHENDVVPFVVMSPDKQIAAIDRMGYGLAEWAIVSLGPAKRWSFAITDAVLWTQRQRSK